MFPPIVHVPSDARDRGKSVLFFLHTFCNSNKVSPDSTVIDLSKVLISLTLFSLVRFRTIWLSSNDICPPTSPVLPPWLIIGVFVEYAIFKIFETSFVDFGFIIAPAFPV